MKTQMVSTNRLIADQLQLHKLVINEQSYRNKLSDEAYVVVKRTDTERHN